MKISIITGDITKLTCDAIVNAANSSLMGGGGVDGAIHRAAGPELLEECKAIVAKQGSLPPGEAVITKAGKLPCKYVIHTVGPFWRGGNNNEDIILASCYKSCLSLAIQNNIKTIAFPAISTGAYRFPKNIAAKIAYKTVINHPDKDSFDEIIFVFFSDSDRTEFCEAIEKLN
jgi:O-acetyl-ADP-ribose deacetylase (regulator of RNase III)